MRTNVADYAGRPRDAVDVRGFCGGAASMIGMPPFRRRRAKLWLIAAASGAGLDLGGRPRGVAAVLTFVHLGPLAASALAGRPPTDAFN